MKIRQIADKFIKDGDGEAVKREAAKYPEPEEVLKMVRFYVKLERRRLKSE